MQIMKCPICKSGELFLYKVTEKNYQIRLTKDNKISKSKNMRDVSEYDTTMDYLECDNSDCGKWFDYELDENGRINKKLLIERH